MTYNFNTLLFEKVLIFIINFQLSSETPNKLKIMVNNENPKSENQREHVILKVEYTEEGKQIYLQLYLS